MECPVEGSDHSKWRILRLTSFRFFKMFLKFVSSSGEGNSPFINKRAVSSKDECLKTVERIRSNIEDYNFSNDEINENMTISIGLAEFPNDSQETRGLIRFADEMMYEVKKLGGNMAK